MQHIRDLALMKILNKYFKSGSIYKYSDKPAVCLTIFNFSDLTNILIPIFEQYPIKGEKKLDFLDWLKIATLTEEGSHLTAEGLDFIRKIKEGMNTSRFKE